MRILYLSPGCFDMGGISRYNRYQIQALREIVGPENVKVLSLLGKENGGFKENFEVYWTANGIRPHQKVRYIFKSFSICLSWKPNIILCAHVNLSGLANVLANTIGAISVLNTYGLEIWSDLTKGAAWGLEKSKYIISDCHYTANYLVDQKTRTGKNISVIWDCVNLNDFNPKAVNPALIRKYDLPDPGKYFNILTLGRLSYTARHKGYERLIQVFKQVVEEENKARLIFAGKGDFVPELKKLVSQSHLENKVHFTGMVDDDDLADVYSSAHLFSLVSDRGKNRGEGIPLTPLEAMACGTPIIVGNQDGSQEAVIDNKNGFVIDPFDTEMHKTIILDLIRNKEKLYSLEKETTKIASDYFSYHHFKSKHVDLLKKLSSGIG